MTPFGFNVAPNASGSAVLFKATISDSNFGLVSEPLIIYLNLFDPMVLVDGNMLASKDFIGTVSNECVMPLQETLYPAPQACDFQDIYAKGRSTATTEDDYNRVFYVKFQSWVRIRSFFADVFNSIEVDVYVAYDQPQRDDSRWLCQKKIILNGVFNCPWSMAGTYLIFWPSPGQNLANLQMRELRVWNRHDHAAIGVPVDVKLGVLRTNTV